MRAWLWVLLAGLVSCCTRDKLYGFGNQQTGTLRVLAMHETAGGDLILAFRDTKFVSYTSVIKFDNTGKILWYRDVSYRSGDEYNAKAFSTGIQISFTDAYKYSPNSTYTDSYVYVNTAKIDYVTGDLIHQGGIYKSFYSPSTNNRRRWAAANKGNIPGYFGDGRTVAVIRQTNPTYGLYTHFFVIDPSDNTYVQFQYTTKNHQFNMDGDSIDTNLGWFSGKCESESYSTSWFVAKVTHVKNGPATINNFQKYKSNTAGVGKRMSAADDGTSVFFTMPVANNGFFIWQYTRSGFTLQNTFKVVDATVGNDRVLLHMSNGNLYLTLMKHTEVDYTKILQFNSTRDGFSTEYRINTTLALGSLIRQIPAIIPANGGGHWIAVRQKTNNKNWFAKVNDTFHFTGTCTALTTTQATPPVPTPFGSEVIQHTNAGSLSFSSVNNFVAQQGLSTPLPDRINLIYYDEDCGTLPQPTDHQYVSGLTDMSYRAPPDATTQTGMTHTFTSCWYSGYKYDVFNNGTNVTDTSMVYDSSTGTFTIDPSLLPAGEHSVEIKGYVYPKVVSQTVIPVHSFIVYIYNDKPVVDSFNSTWVQSQLTTLHYQLVWSDFENNPLVSQNITMVGAAEQPTMVVHNATVFNITWVLTEATTVGNYTGMIEIWDAKHTTNTTQIPITAQVRENIGPAPTNLNTTMTLSTCLPSDQTLTIIDRDGDLIDSIWFENPSNASWIDFNTSSYELTFNVTLDDLDQNQTFSILGNDTHPKVSNTSFTINVVKNGNYSTFNSTSIMSPGEVLAYNQPGWFTGIGTNTDLTTQNTTIFEFVNETGAWEVTNKTWLRFNKATYTWEITETRKEHVGKHYFKLMVNSTCDGVVNRTFNLEVIQKVSAMAELGGTMTKISSAMMAANTVRSAASSFDPSFWAMVNVIQLARTVTLLQVNVSYNVEDFLLQEMGLFNLEIPYVEEASAFLSGIDFSAFQLQDLEFSEKYNANFGLGTVLFLGYFFNTLLTFTLIMLMLLVLFAIMYLVVECIFHWREKKINIIWKVYEQVKSLTFYNLPIRMGMEYFLNMCLLSSLNLTNQMFEAGPVFMISFIMSTAFVVLVITYLRVITEYFLSTKRVNRPETWSMTIEEYFIETKPKSSAVLFNQHIFLYTRIILAINCSLTHSIPLYLQAAIHFFPQGLHVGVLLLWNPFKTRWIHFMHILLELTNCILFTCLFLWVYYKDETLKGISIGEVVVTIFSVAQVLVGGITYAELFSRLVIRIHRKRKQKCPCKKKRKKRKRVAKIAETMSVEPFNNENPDCWNIEKKFQKVEDYRIKKDQIKFKM